MKLPTVKKKLAVVVATGIILTSAASAGALMVVNNKQPQKATAENIPVQTSVTPEPTSTPNTPVTPTVSPSSTPTPSTTPTPSPAPTPTNPYSKNSMTGYVFDKRVSAGKVVAAWGLPNTWPAYAKQAGLTVDHSPQLYDAAYSGGGIWFVESINADGTVTMTSYNTPYDSGLTTHIFPANQIPSFQFIH